MKNEIVSEVCGGMFGEERVNNSVALLSKVSIAFSVGVGRCNSSSPCLFKEKTLFTAATPVQRPDGMVMQPSGLLVLFMGRAVKDVVPCYNLQFRSLHA